MKKKKAPARSGHVPNTSRRRNGVFLRALFKIMVAHADGIRARDALAKVEADVPLTEYEAGHFDTGARRFEKIVRWATVDCVKAGWMVKQHGTWLLTNEGRQAYKKYPDPEELATEAARLYREWSQGRSIDVEPRTENLEQGNARAARVTYEQAEEQSRGDIEQFLRSMQPYEFQQLVADLLEAMGYHVAWIAPPGPDGGVDIVAWSDPLGTRPPRIKVQVKRLGTNVSVDGLRSFMSLLAQEDVGLFVTTAGFTREAQDLARRQENRQVTLVDLNRLLDLWVEHYAKLTDEARRRFPLQQLWFLAPEA